MTDGQLLETSLSIKGPEIKWSSRSRSGSSRSPTELEASREENFIQISLQNLQNRCHTKRLQF